MTPIKTTHLEPYNTATWLELRHTGICNSEIFAALCHTDAYETAYHLWRRKTGLDSEELPVNQTVRNSHYFHEAMCEYFYDTSPYVIRRKYHTDENDSFPRLVIRDDEHPCCLAAVTRIYCEKNCENCKNCENPDPINTPEEAVKSIEITYTPRGVLLCRTTQKTVDPDNLPEPWLLELQWQMRLANLEHGVIAWMGAGRQFGWREFDLDEALADRLREAVADFWQTYVEGKIAPKPMNSDDIQTMYAHAETGKRIEADEEILAKFTTLKALLPQLAALSDQKSALEDELKLFMGDAEAITHLGSILATWKAPKATLRFDAKAFQRAHPEEAKEYMVEQASTRRFLVK